VTSLPLDSRTRAIFRSAEFGFLGVMVREAGAGRDQVAEDHVLLQADQVVDLAGQGRLGEHLGRLLEAGGRDEAGALHGRLGDAQQLRAGGGRLGRVPLAGLPPSASIWAFTCSRLPWARSPRLEVAVALVGDLHALGERAAR
jgi:hypothetical protein